MGKVKLKYESPTTVMSELLVESMLTVSGVPQITNEVKTNQVEDLTEDNAWEVSWD